MTLAALIYSNIVEAIGTGTGNRVYTAPVPSNNAMPVAAYKQIYGAHTIRTVTNGSTVSAWASRWQIDILAATFTEAETLRVALINHFDSLSDSGDGVTIYDVIVDMSFTVYENEMKAQRAITDINVISDGP